METNFDRFGLKCELFQSYLIGLVYGKFTSLKFSCLCRAAIFGSALGALESVSTSEVQLIHDGSAAGHQFRTEIARTKSLHEGLWAMIAKSEMSVKIWLYKHSSALIL